MILSFHPCYEGDENRLCAGRDPGEAEREAMRKAFAVILPQGCRESLYRMAKDACPHVFPDYEARFAYPGKTGQIRLFQKIGTLHPRSLVFSNSADFYQRYGKKKAALPLSFPLVLKRDWGGEGEGVFLVDTDDALWEMAMAGKGVAGPGESPFLVQEYLPPGNRSLRVVVIGEILCSYWRIQPDPGMFLANLAAGGVVDAEADPDLQKAGREAALKLCRKTGINLAGFDLLFQDKGFGPKSVFLEINYFFGRKGIGGSDRYYRILTQAIDRWLSGLGLEKADER